ncbi:oligosaccharide flippase family protein [Vibrio diabolicus]|uniref:oligosaccharide flippase family protein n=1 Tax=Vibrio diabolicus TaxID=50719 RepID=UPI003752687B
MLKKFRNRASPANEAFIYLAANILSSALPFLLLPVLTRYLTPEQYGEVAMFQVLVGVLAAFVGVNVNGALVRYYYQSKDNEIAGYISSCVFILITSTALTFLIFKIAQDYIVEIIGLSKEFLYIALAVSFFSFIFKIRLSQYQVRKSATKYGGLQILNSLLAVFISLVLVVCYGLAAEGRIYGIFFASVLIGVVAALLLYNDRLFAFDRVKAAYFYDALSYGVKIIPHVLGIFLLSSFDRFVIASNLGLRDAGIYMSAAQIAIVMNMVFDGINKAYVPWLFSVLKGDSKVNKLKIIRFTKIYVMLLITFVPLSYFISPYLGAIVLGSEFSEAADILKWIVIAQCFSGIYMIFTNFIIFEKRTGSLSLITISTGMIHILLSVLLINEVGIYGVAYSLILAMSLRAILTFYLTYKVSKIDWF